MDKIYLLHNAITLNATGIKYNAVAAEVPLVEIKKRSHYFSFDFAGLKKQKSTVYKLCKQGDEDVWQGLVAFTARQGFVYCFNMEVAGFNKKPALLYDGVGKSMVALCCKISYDLGFEGVISFEAKNRLFNYYKRFGALQMGGSNRFFIEEANAAKLIKSYF